MPLVNGTSGNDALNGTSGDDTINDGGAGNDTLHGGDGNDVLQSSGGSDSLYGDLGYDSIYVRTADPTSSVVIDAGGGNDRLYLNDQPFFGVAGWTLNATMGVGSDFVFVGRTGTGSIDLGADDDRVTIIYTAGSTTITLGDGADEVELGSYDISGSGSSINQWGGTTILTDYVPGVDYVTARLNETSFYSWNGTSNPFAVGLLQLVQQGNDAVLQLNYYGATGGGWTDLLRFENVSASSLTASDLFGYDPHGAAATGLVINGTELNDQSAGTDTLQHLVGGLMGGNGADTIHGLGGDDVIAGFAGSDLLYGDAGNDTIHAGVGNDLVWGGDGDDWIQSTGGSALLHGEAGNDTLGSVNGRAGTALLDGGAGDDLLMISSTPGSADRHFLVMGGDGNDHLYVNPTDSNSNAVDLGAGADILTLYGRSGANVVLGAGADVVDISSFAIASGLLAVIRDYAPGVDTIQIDYLSSLQNWNGTDNPFTTGHLRLVQDGGATLLQVDVNGGGDGYVTVVTFENIAASAFTASDFGGHQPSVYSDVGVTLAGTSGGETLNGSAGRDQISGSGGNDTLLGFDGNDLLNGGAGNDILDGGAGADTATYASATAGVSVNLGTSSAQPTGGAGSDTLIGIENLIGSAFADDLLGNAVNNTLNGGGGADRLVAYAGDDLLDGGTGVDVMRGGLGDDTYYVDSSTDKVIEISGEGNDSVYSSVTYAIAGNVENLFLTGSAFRANGNTLGNYLVGTSGDNILNGAGGADVMNGGAGNDTYFVDNIGDSIIEGSGGGNDRVYTTVSYTAPGNVEDIFIRGATAASATGNELNNSIRGNGANNVITGGAGLDRVTGGGGADTFVFHDGDFAGMGPGTADQIRDFSTLQGDHIDLSGVDANTLSGGDQAFAFIGTAGFHHVAGELRYDIVNGTTYVYGDTNGDGVSDFMIRLDGNHTMSASDFGL